MQWVLIVAALVVAFFIFKFLVKPLFKLALLVGLGLVVWLLLTNLH